MQSTNDISLRSFYVFNSTYGPEQGEEANKILFYYPREIDEDTQIKDVGLSEAIIKFTSSFAGEEHVKSLHTKKTSQLFYQPETDFWMVMTINVPYEEKSRDNSNEKEYRGDDVHDSIYLAVLKQHYHSFRLFNDKFSKNAVGVTLEERMRAIRTKLRTFYTKQLLTAKLKSADILDVFNSTHYLGLNQSLFLRLQIFINMIESAFVSVKHCIFLYNECVVWSGINPVDLYSMNEYLTDTLFPKARQISRELNEPGTRRRLAFLTGPPVIDGMDPMPKVYIYNSDEMKEYNLAVYQSNASTICLFIEDNETDNERTFFKEMHAFIGPQLLTLSADIAKDLLPVTPEKSSSDQQISKFLYFNELNKVHQGTIHTRGPFGLSDTVKPSSTISRELTNLIADLYDDRSGRQDLYQETDLKTHNDYWIVRRTSNFRHFFIVLNKNCTLLETQQETEKAIEANVKNVFF